MSNSTVSPALVTDLYQLTMAEAYLRAGMNERATFSLYIRRLPPERRYLIAAGLDAVLDYLQEFHFTDDDLAYLRSTGLFSSDLLAFLARLRFTGDIMAMPEGTPAFAEEPLVEVTAPLIEAQLVETYLINVLHLHTLLASKAARCVDAAGGRPVIDFGLRRAHGVDAGMAAARASYLSGCAGTSNVAAGQRFGIPISGTMAHSFITSFDTEINAFRAYARAYPDGPTLLIDTYDTLKGAHHAVTVAKELAARGGALHAVRIDSGDVAALARTVREILDAAGFTVVQIIASGGLDEHSIGAIVVGGTPIDGFGVGTRMDASEDAPTLEAAYKLVEYRGVPRLKLSDGKASWAGCKQVWRHADTDGVSSHDTIAAAGEPIEGAAPLLVPVMGGGRRRQPRTTLDDLRNRCLAERARLPEAVRRIDGDGAYPVQFSPGIRAVQQAARAHLAR